MRLLHAVALIALIASPALAQTKPVPRYGEVDKPKTAGELESERAAESAYKKSLGNVPNSSAAVDPWGNVRGGTSAQPAAKTSAGKRAKSGTTPN